MGKKICIGKSILASIIVEEVGKLKACHTSAAGRAQISLAFFYCKHGDRNKSSFLAVMRGLISQLLQQNPEILALIEHDMTLSGERTLTSDAEKFLGYTIGGSLATTTYIIIDGLDECDTEEMVSIVTTLNTVAEPLNTANPAACRLFFTSRNEAAISRALSTWKAVRLQIRPKDNEKDIKEYTELWSAKIQARFELTNVERRELESRLLSRADGMLMNTTSSDCHCESSVVR